MEGEQSNNLHTDANIGPSDCCTTPTKIDYPEHVKSSDDKDAYKVEFMSAHSETLFADYDKGGNITNLIFLTSNYMAWHQAILDHYETATSGGIQGGHGKKIDIGIEVDKTTVSLYKSGKVVINSNWKPFVKDFSKIKERAQTKKLLKIDKQNKSLVTEPNWPVEMKEMRDKMSLLESWQVRIEEEVKQSRPSSKDRYIDMERTTVAKTLEESSAQERRQLKEEFIKLEKSSAQERRQLREEMAKLKASLSQEKGQLEGEVRKLRDEVRELTDKLDLAQTQNSERHERVVTIEQEQIEPLSQAEATVVQESQSQEVQAPTGPNTDPLENNLPQSPQIVLLMDSNGKYVEGKKLFPKHRVMQEKCANTNRALEWLTEENLGSPSHIIIHTGTNNLRKQSGHQVVQSVKKMIEKAIAKFPNAKVTISALLPRLDIPVDIQRINAEISRVCAMKQNVYFATHPTLDRESLWDDVHLCKAAVPAFAKSLKDVALGRKPNTSYRSSRETLNSSRQLAPPRAQYPRRPHTTPRGPPRQPPAAFRDHNTTQASPPTFTVTPHQTHTPTPMQAQAPHPPHTYAQAVIGTTTTQSRVPTFTQEQMQQVLSEVFTRMAQANIGF